MKTLRTLTVLALFLFCACEDEQSTQSIQDTAGQDAGLDTAVQDIAGQDTAGSDAGLDTAGQDTAGQDTTAQDTTVGQDTAGQDTTVGQDTAGQDTTPGVDSSTGTPICPADAPAAQSVCPQLDLVCEYGDDPRRSCRIRATCSADSTGGSDPLWNVAVPRCPPPPVTTCPVTIEDARGQVCDPDGAICEFGDLACFCTICPRGAPLCGSTPTWDCDFPNTSPGCPASLARLGDPCTEEGLKCTYQCGAEGARTCTGGAWAPSDGGGCPVSNRSVKKDIRYLTDVQRTEIARTLLDFKLALYTYDHPTLPIDPKLGFIIEDRPKDSFAVESSGVMVDVYGYASMLLATVQHQQQQLETMQSEIKSMGEELKALQSRLDALR